MPARLRPALSRTPLASSPERCGRAGTSATPPTPASNDGYCGYKDLSGAIESGIRFGYNRLMVNLRPALLIGLILCALLMPTQLTSSHGHCERPTAAPFARGSDVSPQEAALNIEKRLASLRSLEAEFEQTYSSSSISTPLLEKGKFYFRKPDLMRWEYQAPEPMTYLYKEGLVLVYYPEENQLYRHALAPEEENSTIFSVLTGRARLEDDYVLEPADFPSDEKSRVQLKLTPREEGEFSYILLETDAKTWLITTAVFFDWAGNRNEFRFRRVKVNPSLAPQTFVLKIPPDAEVIEDLPPAKK
jgi:outer membrane lipoprotein-sorting protein